MENVATHAKTAAPRNMERNDIDVNPRQNSWPAESNGDDMVWYGIVSMPFRQASENYRRTPNVSRSFVYLPSYRTIALTYSPFCLNRCLAALKYCTVFCFCLWGVQQWPHTQLKNYFSRNTEVSSRSAWRRLSRLLLRHLSKQSFHGYSWDNNASRSVPSACLQHSDRAISFAKSPTSRVIAEVVVVPPRRLR